MGIKELPETESGCKLCLTNLLRSLLEYESYQNNLMNVFVRQNNITIYKKALSLGLVFDRRTIYKYKLDTYEPENRILQTA